MKRTMVSDPCSGEVEVVTEYTREDVVEAFESRGIDPSFLDAYGEPERFYHGWEHILELIRELRINLSSELDFPLLCAVAFHDAVYDVTKSDNEERSADLFVRTVTSGLTPEQVAEVRGAILSTRTHVPEDTWTSKRLCQADMAPLLTGSLDRIFEDERKIFKEYQSYPTHAYASERGAFLRSVAREYGTAEDAAERLRALAIHVERRTVRVAYLVHGFGEGSGSDELIAELERGFDKVALAQYAQWKSGEHKIRWTEGLGRFERFTWYHERDLLDRVILEKGCTVAVAYTDETREEAERLVDRFRAAEPGVSYITVPVGLKWRKFTAEQLRLL